MVEAFPNNVKDDLRFLPTNENFYERGFATFTKHKHILAILKRRKIIIRK